MVAYLTHLLVAVTRNLRQRDSGADQSRRAPAQPNPAVSLAFHLRAVSILGIPNPDPQYLLVIRLRRCLALLPAFAGAMLLLLKSRARKPVRQRSLHHGHRISGHQRFLLRRLFRDRQSTLRDQFHGPLDGNPHLAVRLIDPTVMPEQQILALMQIRQVLVSVIGLQPRSREGLRQLLQLLLLLPPGSTPCSSACPPTRPNWHSILFVGPSCFARP